MNRREFILASGTAILTGTGMSATKQPAVGLEFELSTTPDDDPQSVDSILVDFSRFKLTPHYIDRSEDLSLQITVSLDGIDSTKIQADVPVKQDIGRGDISSKLPLSIDGIDTSQNPITGFVEIVVEHSNLDSQTYTQYFEISNRVGIIDDFEDGNLKEYVVKDPAVSETVQSSTVFKGSNALKLAFSDDSSDKIGARIYSGSGLDRYPQRGDTFQLRAYLESDGKANAFDFRFASDGTGNNDMILRLNDTAEQIEINIVTEGNFNRIASASTDIPQDQWLKIVCDWGLNGEIKFDLYDESGSLVASASGYDVNYVDGGIDFYGNLAQTTASYMNIYFDDVRITDVSFRNGVIDDFEDGDVNGYSQFGGSGSFTAQTSTVQEGTYAGQLTADESYTTTQYYSDSKLARYPRSGDTFRFWIKDDGYNVGMNFGVSDPGGETIDDGYRFLYNAGGPEYTLYSIVNGSGTVVASDGLEHSTQIWREIEIEWGESGSFTITVYDMSGNQIQQFTGSNSDHKAGGFGWAVRGNSSAPTSGWFDNARITSFSNNQ